MVWYGMVEAELYIGRGSLIAAVAVVVSFGRQVLVFPGASAEVQLCRSGITAKYAQYALVDHIISYHII